MTFYPRDITPLSVYEETEWIGMEGQCDKCRVLYFIQAPYHSGRCPKCEYGWVTCAPRLMQRLETANYLEFREEMRIRKEKEAALRAKAAEERC